MGFRERIARFMYGRYGSDGLNQWISGTVLVLIVLNLFLQWSVISILELALLVFAIFRMLSRNIDRRRKENNTFYKYKGKLTGWFRRQWSMLKQRKAYHIYTCPGCKQKIRIPRGKGRIEISCPKCRTTFIKKS